MQKVIAIIPARGASKAIPRKNIRILAGKPLIGYVIDAAKSCALIDRVVVTTDDQEIAAVAASFGAVVVDRPEELAGDDVPLDPVIWHAVTQMEQQGEEFDIVLTIQPTSPLLRADTIERAIRMLVEGENEVETVISVVPQHHLYWQQDGDNWLPMFSERKNRQYLQPIYQETGGILATHRSCVTPTSRIGARTRGLVLETRESLDINDWGDWYLVEHTMMPQLKIAFVAYGDATIGLGHIYRGLALAWAFAERGDFTFLSQEDADLGMQLLTRKGAKVVTYEDEGDLFDILRSMDVDIVINDILDTSAAYVNSLKSSGTFVVNFEDLGHGSLKADLVINALYDDMYLKSTHYVGPEYECLRQEFLEAPIKELDPQITNVLITFGGIDASNLTVRVLQALEDSLTSEMSITVIVGLGYPYLDQLNAMLTDYQGMVQVFQNISKMSEHILQADVVFTSAGRTVLEVMSIGTPCVVIVQNARETRHRHANSQYGIMNLGLEQEVNAQKISQALQVLSDDFSLRQEMRRRMLRVPMRDGYNRIKNLILNNYQSFLAKNGANG